MAYYRGRNGKYNARKVNFDGHTFDSCREAQRYQELKWMEQAKLISDLQLQVKYLLIPAYYEESDEVYTRGIHKGEKKKGKTIQQECVYIADFVYKDEKGNTIVEDAKGMKTKEYAIKKKLMYHVHRILIKEV